MRSTPIDERVYNPGILGLLLAGVHEKLLRGKRADLRRREVAVSPRVWWRGRFLYTPAPPIMKMLDVIDHRKR